MYKYVLFDLDGTLSDPKVGICTSVQQALSKIGIEEPDIDKLEPFIGPSLKYSFQEFYHLDEETTQKAITYYRERYSTVGKFENELYPGMAELLRDLKKKGKTVAIASGKPTPFVEDILEHFEIRQYFDVVVGSELDGSRDDKTSIMKEAIHQIFGEEEPEYDEMVMVGDRKFDVESAFEIGIPCIAVTYGYGSREELEAAGAEKIVNTVNGLRATLLPVMGSAAASYKRPDGAGQNGSDVGNAQGSDKQGGNSVNRDDLKAMGKEAGKQSFANMWGFIGPALMYWIGRSAIAYALFLVIFQTFFSKYIDAEGKPAPEVADTLYLVEYLVYAAAAGLVLLFLIKEFKSVIRRAKSEPKPEKLPIKDIAIVGLGSILMAVGLGAISVISNAAYSAAVTAQQAEASADAAQVVQTVAYKPPFWIGLIVAGILLPVIQEAVFTGICYNRARRYMNSMPLILSAVVYGFIHRSDENNFPMMLLMGVSMFVYAISKNIYISGGIFVLSSVILYIVSNVALPDILLTGLTAPIIAALGLTAVVVIYLKGRKSEKLAKDNFFKIK